MSATHDWHQGAYICNPLLDNTWITYHLGEITSQQFICELWWRPTWWSTKTLHSSSENMLPMDHKRKLIWKLNANKHTKVASTDEVVQDTSRHTQGKIAQCNDQSQPSSNSVPTDFNTLQFHPLKMTIPRHLCSHQLQHITISSLKDNYS